MEFSLEDLEQVMLALRNRADKLDRILDETISEQARNGIIDEIHHCHSLARRVTAEVLAKQ